MAPSSRRTLLSFLTVLLLTVLPVTAQFHFFEQMFGGQQQHHQHRHHQHAQQRQGDVQSDSSWYRQVYAQARCSKYLCPGTLSCVDKPTHCPCAWPAHEDKVELGDGLAICASKGGYKEGEMARKVELARKGMM